MADGQRRRSAVRPTRHDLRPLRVHHAQQGPPLRPEQQRGLTRDRGEDLVGRRLTGHEGGHTTQGRVLACRRGAANGEVDLGYGAWDPGAFGPSDGADRIGGSWLPHGVSQFGGGHREPASEANWADDVARLRASASMRWAMNCASSLTQPSSAEPRVCCHSRPRKYKPGTSVTPRWWRILASSSKIGSCTKEWSSRNPVAHTTPSTVSSEPSANVTAVPLAAVARGRSRMPSLRAARGLEPMSVSLSFRRCARRESTVLYIRPVACRYRNRSRPRMRCGSGI